MVPLVELVSEEDVENLGPYEDAGNSTLVELPHYLTDRSNKYQESVSALFDQYGNAQDFYLDHSDNIDIPVVSGSIEPIDYAELRPILQDLTSEFDQIAVRLMISGFSNPLTRDQKDSLEELNSAVRNEDILLFDLLDNGVTDVLKDDLRYLSDLFEDNTKAVLNAFDAYDDHPDNQSPAIADDIGATAFGDYGINLRFKPKGGGPTEETRLRHYYPDHSTVQFFRGDDYQDAAEDLRDWNEWDRSHCDGCRRADRTTNNDANTWSQIKMEHYFSSVLQGQI